MNASSIAKRLPVINRLLKALRRLQKEHGGSVAPLFGIAAIPLITAVGASVDYSRAAASKTAMQGAADATSLALAKEAIDGTNSLQAQPMFVSLFSRRDVTITSVKSTADQSGNSTSVTVAATGSIPTTVMQIMGYRQMALRASSTAAATKRIDGCVLALNKTANSAVSMGGSTNVSLSGCSVYSNSKSSTALSVSGSATLSAESIGTTGDVSISSSNVTTTDGVQTHLQGIEDPYAAVQMPSYGACDQTNLNVKTAATIDPGVYCNGITVNAGATLTLNPGIYFIDRGSFSVNGGATVSGTGVTLVFTSSTGNNWATLSINGNAAVNLSAPLSGATAGLAVFGDRNMPLGTSFKLNGGSNQLFGGAIYIPSGSVSYAGGASTSMSCTQVIGDTVAFTGNSNVAINCSHYPTKPFGATSVRLIS